jgi:hypothetical protein
MAKTETAVVPIPRPEPKDFSAVLGVDSIEWLDDRYLTFLRELCNCGIISESCRRAGMHRNSITVARRNHPEFDEICKVALEVHNAVIQDEIRRRAIDGVDKPVYQQGKCVGYVREYSDSLLLALAKSRMPEFRDRHDFTLELKDQIKAAADRY